MNGDARFVYRSEAFTTVLMVAFLAIFAQVVGRVAPNLAFASPGTTSWLAAKLAVGAYFIVMGVAIISARVFDARTVPSPVRYASHFGWLFVAGGIGLDVVLLLVTRYRVGAVIASSLVLAACALVQVLLFLVVRRARPN